MRHGISEASLQAYVDGQLDVAERVEVETYLQAHPAAAAMVMEELRQRDELRLFMGDPGDPPSATMLAEAQRLERQLGWQVTARRWRGGLAAACLVGLGWFAHAELGVLQAAQAVPAYADEAVEASRTVHLIMAENHDPGPAMLPLPARNGGLVRVPALPAELSLMGSSLVPWKGGDALLALYRASTDQVVTLFATDPGTFAVTAPQLGLVQGAPTVFWQDGHSAFALGGDLPEARLLQIARQAAPWR